MHMMEDSEDARAAGYGSSNGGGSGPSIAPPSKPAMDPRATVVLIGFRGIGKSTLGLIIATHMGRSFIDADRALSRQAGCSPNEYVIKHSWEKFRDLETDILRRLLAEHPQDYVIACGGGVVEREENRAMLKEFGRSIGPVIHITREKEEVIRYLIDEKDRPQWGEDMRTVWTRRYPLFEECSTHTYASLTVHSSLLHPKCPSLVLKDVEKDFIRFATRISSPTPITMPSMNRRSYSLTLDLPVPQDIDYRTMNSATAGVDAIELRVDSIRRAPSSFRTPAPTPASNPGCPDHAYVAFAVAHLRRLSTLPIIYAIRTLKAVGSFVFSPETEDDYFNLAIYAFKLGVEYLDIEINTNPDLVKRIMQHKPVNTRIILTFVDETDSLHWHDHQVAHIYLQAQELGADACRIRLSAETSEDNVEIEQFIKKTLAISPAGSYPGIPVIAANAGRRGKMSPIFNEFLTPVNHPALPSLHAHARGTFAEIQRTLAGCGMLPHQAITYRRRIGPQDLVDHRPIIKAGLNILGLPVSIDEDVNGDTQTTLSGALVSLPLLNTITQGTISPSCAWTHHIDAIILDSDSESDQSDPTAQLPAVQYHNIRSLGIADTIYEALSPINAITEVSTALLIGASGQRGREAAYALRHLGVPLIFCVACEASIEESPQLIHLDNPALLARRKPTIIISFSNSLPMAIDQNVLSALTASPTGGTLIELDTLSGPGPLVRTIVQNGKKDAWVCLARQDVEFQVLQREFELITRCRLPLEAFTAAR